MKDDLRFLLASFTSADRRRLIGYVLVQFVVGLLDLVGIAIVLPLMQTLTGTSLEDGLLGRLHRALGEAPRDQFVYQLAGLMAVAFVLKALVSSLAIWWSTGFIARLQTGTARRLLSRYMSEGYLDHRRRNTGEVVGTIGSGVQGAHVGVLGGLLNITSSALSISLIVVFMLVVAPLPTLAALAYFGLAVFVLQRLLAPANRRAGEEAQYTAWVSAHALVDAVQGFREATLHNAREYFVDRFSVANTRNAMAARTANFLMQIPKQVLELVTMLGIVLLIVIVVAAGSASSALPTLSLFVAAAVKILPLMVALTATLGTVRVGREGLRVTVDALRQAEPKSPASSPADAGSGPRHDADAPRRIEVREVSFRYPDGDADVLTGIDLSIAPGTSVAFCGVSGSGKTTLVDIILGLLPPTSGQVSYAGRPVVDDPAWRDIVAYVPQDVYVADDTVLGNVAFGVPEAERDPDAVRRALQRAELLDVVQSMPEGLETRVGERGTRLSGGQRQRLGIARALYRDPQVLVLDEATSALDNDTEHRITNTINGLRGQITTVVVAHRLSTVRHVDELVFLAHGRVAARGSFTEVVERSPEFARLVALGRLDDWGASA